MTLLAPTLQAFFTQRLLSERNASPETVASYRDTIRLLVNYAHDRTGKAPYQLDFDDLDASLIGAFLSHLETDRHNSPSTRNNRLAARRSRRAGWMVGTVRSPAKVLVGWIWRRTSLPDISSGTLTAVDRTTTSPAARRRSLTRRAASSPMRSPVVVAKGTTTAHRGSIASSRRSSSPSVKNLRSA